MRNRQQVVNLPIVFDEAGTIYFCKKATNTRCHVCHEHFKEGDAYKVSKCGRAFRHVKCTLEQVKQ